MSLFKPEDTPCPNCGTVATIDTFSSINGDRRPDLSETVILGDLQRHTCSNCGVEFRVEPSINYLCINEGLWMMARPSPEILHWEDEVEDALHSFEIAYGGQAAPAAQEIGALLTVRLTFGFPAFREKIILARANVDDVTAELMKLAVLTSRPGNPIEPGVELRILGVRDDEFDMVWVDVETNELIDMFTAPRALFDEVGRNSEWDDLRKKLASGPFVDTARLSIIAEPRTEPA